MPGPCKLWPNKPVLRRSTVRYYISEGGSGIGIWQICSDHYRRTSHGRTLTARNC